MQRASYFLILLVSSFLPSSTVLAAPVTGAAPPGAAPAQPPAPGAEDNRELQRLLDKVTALTDLISRNPQSPLVWRYNMEQAELLLLLAARASGEERDQWLRLAIDNQYSAALQSPSSEQAAYQRLAQLPEQVLRIFSGSPLYSYASRQVIQAEYLRALANGGEDPARAQDRHCLRLVRFVQDYPSAPEVSQAVQEAAQLSEQQGKTEDAGRCYRYLTEHFAGQDLARNSRGALWRLGQSREPLRLELPLLYAGPDNGEAPFDLKQLPGKVVVVYFWSSANAQAAADFQVLNQLHNLYQSFGLEIVNVSLDSDPARARAFLSGHFTAGVHLSERSGLEGALVASHGIQKVPQVIIVGKDGMLLRHSLQPAQLEPELSRLLGHHE